MNIEQALIDEHSKAQTMRIIDYIGKNQKRFDELIRIFLESDYRICQRAAWTLTHFPETSFNLFEKHHEALISMLNRTDVHDAIYRNIFRVYVDLTIPEDFEGLIYDCALKFAAIPKYAIAIRANAIHVAAKIACNYTELQQEILLVLEELEQEPSAAMKGRCKLVRKMLDQKKKGSNN